jgi:hypothetical protein
MTLSESLDVILEGVTGMKAITREQAAQLADLRLRVEALESDQLAVAAKVAAILAAING